MARRAASPPGRTGSDFIEFLNDAMRRRALASQTGADYILACTDILAFTQGENWRAVDVTHLDLEKLRLRLITQKGDAQLRRYHERFEPALHLFLEHLGLEARIDGRPQPEKPPDPAPPPRAKKHRRPSPTPARTPSTPLPKVVPMSPVPSMSTPSVLPYLFPVREGVVAALCLPSDLTPDEAGRLASYIHALALPASPNGSAVLTATDSAGSGNGH